VYDGMSVFIVSFFSPIQFIISSLASFGKADFDKANMFSNFFSNIAVGCKIAL